MTPNQPTAEQKRFRENLRSLYPGFEIHHIFGRTAKIKGVGNIGHWGIIAMPPDHDLGIIKKLNHGERKPYEKALFTRQMRRYAMRYGAVPVPDDVMREIQAWHL